MSDLADLFPHYESHFIATEAGKIFTRVGGKAGGKPLVLVHGFPQTHVMWHRIAPELAKHFRIVLIDLRGYGWSSAPKATRENDPTHFTYSKRAMAQDVVKVMEELGHVRFSYLGHDRGARVGYRLALDHPGRLERLSLLDIIPTLNMWENMTAARAMQVYHWTFLAQEYPIPETLLKANPTEWQDQKLASWAGSKDLKSFDPRALNHYNTFFLDPSRQNALCEDYRAGASYDLIADKADRDAGKTIDCPVQVLWGASGIPAASSSPLDAWKVFAPQAIGQPIQSGHFPAEENPSDTLAALLPFLQG